MEKEPIAIKALKVGLHLFDRLVVDSIRTRHTADGSTTTVKTHILPSKEIAAKGRVDTMAMDAIRHTLEFNNVDHPKVVDHATAVAAAVKALALTIEK